MSNLPDDLVEEILSRVALTSLSAVRSTCKKWNELSKNRIIDKTATAGRRHFLGFMMKDNKVCSMKFDLQGIGNEAEFVDPSINEVSILDQVKIINIFHCDGLLLCVTKDQSRLLIWNPYLVQTRWIQPRNSFHRLDRYAIGYDKNRNHKILRIFGEYGIVNEDKVLGYEIYDLSSNTWNVSNVNTDFRIDYYHRGVSLKGHTYFLARSDKRGGRASSDEYLLSFDFTTERFGKRLPLPLYSHGLDKYVSLSCVREEQLAVLFDKCMSSQELDIWVTNKIDPGAVSWSKFLRFTSAGYKINHLAGSFFIDEEKKVVVVVDLDEDDKEQIVACCNQTANIIGQDEYFKSVNIGEALKTGKQLKFGHVVPNFCCPLVCSSYVPSLVQLQINQPRTLEENKK